jgi:hypothetical protein
MTSLGYEPAIHLQDLLSHSIITTKIRFLATFVPPTLLSPPLQYATHLLLVGRRESLWLGETETSFTPSSEVARDSVEAMETSNSMSSLEGILGISLSQQHKSRVVQEIFKGILSPEVSYLS